MKFVIARLAPFRWRMLLGFCIKVLATVIELFLPFLLTHILENVIVSLEIGQVIFYGILMVICAALACLFNIIANRMAARVSREFSQKLRDDLFEKTLYLSARDTDAFTVPSLESRLTTDTYNIHNFVGMMQRMGIRAPILLLGGMIISFAMDAYLALVMLALLPFIFLTVYLISRKGVPLYADVQRSVDGMVRVVREDAQGIRVIKALSKNEYENRRYEGVNAVLSGKERHAGTVMGAVNPIMTLLMNLGTVAVIAISANRIAGGLSSAPTVIAFMQYFTIISMAMMTLSRIFVMFTKCSASAARVSEVMDTPDRFFVNRAEAAEKNAPHIEFRHVSFSYFGRKEDLSDISFTLAHGERLGIIGATGSGKSTLIKLLLRFYEPTAGEIFVDGYPLTHYTREELASLFGVSLQNGFLYADTVEENIRFGRDISDGDVVRAARIAQADGFIFEKEDGYAHLLTQKGTNLSGGQKQRLLIARALAARPPILILDDSSSALDYKTDAALRLALDAEEEKGSTVTVAQRVSSVKSCDLILVLEDGRIIGRGKHEDLLENCPEYREISDSQMGGVFLD